MSDTSEPLLLTHEVHDFKDAVEVPGEPLDVHGHNLWSRLAIGIWLFLMVISTILTTIFVTLVNVSYDLLIRFDCTVFWTFQPGMTKTTYTVHLFAILQYVFLALAPYFGYRLIRTWIVGRVVETKTVHIDVRKAHQEKQ